MTILLETDPLSIATLQGVVGTDAQVVGDAVAVTRLLSDDPAHCVVVVGPSPELHAALDLAAAERVERPYVGVVLVRRRVDTTVLKDAMRAGVREVVKLDDVDGLSQACDEAERVAMHLRGSAGATPQPEQSERLGQLVTVFSAKGGCGKTTVATNLAVTMAKAGKTVCLVDLDLAFGDVAISLQLFPTHTIADAVALRRLDATALRALATRHGSGLDALLAPVEPGAAETVSAALVTDLLSTLKRTYDVVVADTPAALSDHALAAFDVTDQFVLLATLDVPAVKNLKLTLEMLELLGYPRDRWRVVLNRADSKVGLSVDDVQKMLNIPIQVQIPSSRAVPASINRGTPIVLDAPGHPVSEAISRIAAVLEPPRTSRRDTGGRTRLSLRRTRATS